MLSVTKSGFKIFLASLHFIMVAIVIQFWGPFVFGSHLHSKPSSHTSVPILIQTWIIVIRFLLHLYVNLKNNQREGKEKLYQVFSVLLNLLR